MIRNILAVVLLAATPNPVLAAPTQTLNSNASAFLAAKGSEYGLQLKGAEIWHISPGAAEARMLAGSAKSRFLDIVSQAAPAQAEQALARALKECQPQASRSQTMFIPLAPDAWKLTAQGFDALLELWRGQGNPGAGLRAATGRGPAWDGTLSRVTALDGGRFFDGAAVRAAATMAAPPEGMATLASSDLGMAALSVAKAATSRQTAMPARTAANTEPSASHGAASWINTIAIDGETRAASTYWVPKSLREWEQALDGAAAWVNAVAPRPLHMAAAATLAGGPAGGVTTYRALSELDEHIAAAASYTFDQDVPAELQDQIRGDLAFIKSIQGQGVSALHKGIFGQVDGGDYTRFFESRVKAIGLDDCGSPKAVACVQPFFNPSKMWLTPNYTSFSHPQIARMMVVFHESRHTEVKHGFWRHAYCPDPFKDEHGEDMKSIFTGSTLAGEPACDRTPLGSYGSSLIMLKNIQKFCSNCTDKVKMDAGLYADDQLGRITDAGAKKSIQDDLYR